MPSFAAVPRFPASLAALPAWRRLALVLACALLAACAQKPLKQAQSADQDDDDDDEQSTSAPATAAAPPAAMSPLNLPNMELSGGILYEFLLAEVALQRGNVGLAAQAYVDLAKKTRDPRVAKRATEIALYARMSDVATESARIWLETEPQSPQALQTLTGLLVSNNRIDEARPYLKSLLVSGGRSPAEGFMQLGRILGGNPDKAATLRTVQELAQPYPALPEAKFAVAQSAVAAGDDALSLAQIREAARLRPDWELAAIFEAQLLQKTSVSAARERLAAFLKLNPKAREARMSYARALVAEQKLPEARAEFQRLLSENPDNPDVVYAVGLLAFQLNDYPAARQSLERLLTMNFRDRNTVRMYLGQIAEEEKNYPDALRRYGEVTRGEQYFNAQLRYAQVLAKQGGLDAARTHLRQVVAADPQQKGQLVLAEAALLRDAKREREAFDLVAGALGEQPENPDLLYDYAMLAEKIDRVDAMETSLRKLIVLRPDHAHAYNALGYSLADRNQRLPEAKQLIEKGLALSPNDAFIIDSMGWVFYRMGDNKTAIEYLRRAYAMRPDAEIAAHLGEVLWANGDRSEAEKIWRDAMEKNPGNETIASTIKRLKP
jgi:tetratricopeptide (TPR) repeat protein